MYNSHTIDFTVEQKVKITNYNHKTSNQQLQPNQNYPLHLTLVVTERSKIRGRQNFELSHEHAHMCEYVTNRVKVKNN